MAKTYSAGNNITDMKNVSESEIRKFEALASRWWDPNSEFRPLHEINPLRVNYISRKINVAEKRVLDVGCGGGILAESMAQHLSLIHI